MPQRPLLRLPNPSPVAPPAGHGAGGNIRFPPRDRQRGKFGPVFSRLRSVLGREAGPLELRDDPSSLAPERVVVFEVAGTVANFLKAVARVDGLEFMTEYETDFERDDDFAVLDGRKGREGHDREDARVSGRFYLAMPDLRALDQLLSLWDRYDRGEPMGRGFAPIGHLFAQLHDLRAWGPQDRIPPETVAFWREQTALHPGRPVRTEVELWFRRSEARRREAGDTLAALVTAAGGHVVAQSVIADIAYHGALIDIPATAVEDLIAQRAVALAVADDIMFLRPQSMLLGPLEVDAAADGSVGRGAPPAAAAPIAALLDGVPVQAHSLLADRLLLDDPDDLQSQATVSRRAHGTAMASLIVHGDRNERGDPLPRRLYVRPLMIATDDGQEHSEPDRLLVDTLYRAVVRIKGSEAEEGVAPTVFLINISMGDIRRPFAGLISPLARLLDFLAERHNVLFLVSGGNVTAPLDIPDFDTWTAFESADAVDRQRAVVKALNAAKGDRTILSPAEALNALTIGAQHHDNVAEPREGGTGRVDPFPDSSLPNVSSGLGLGHRRMVKPELYFPGGREHVRMLATGGGVRIAVGQPQRLYGLRAAAPDGSGQGRLDYTALSDGTSSATALATRAAHRIFDALMDVDGGSAMADMDPQFYAVLVKCLLVHGARWNGEYELLKEICGPADARRHLERAENSCRFIGFGVPDVANVLECTLNRATLVGYGLIEPDSGQSYRIPLPACLERITYPRSLAVTLAWFSPIKAGHQNYRAIRLEAGPLNPQVRLMQMLGVERQKAQPASASVRRGSVFHERFQGAAAVPFVDDGHLSLRVWCKEDLGVVEEGPVRYGIAVTIEAAGALPVYDEIQARLRVRPRA